MIKKPFEKNVLEVGGHDDWMTNLLSDHFKQVFAYYEFIKIPERKSGNIEIAKKPYLEALEEFGEFDVILLENEFHHFPDIWQMWTYEKLRPEQELILVEWDMTGNVNALYGLFQDCAPLCGITRKVLRKFAADGKVEIEQVAKGKYEETHNFKEELIENFKFMLPDHYQFGEKEFLQKIQNLTFPVTLWEGFDVFKIKKVK